MLLVLLSITFCNELEVWFCGDPLEMLYNTTVTQGHAISVSSANIRL